MNKIDVNIDKKNGICTCTVVLPPSTPVYKWPNNQGRILKYEDHTVITVNEIIQIVQQELPKTLCLGRRIMGPGRLHNRNNTERSATWEFEIKSLTIPKNTGKIESSVPSKKKTKGRTKKTS